MVYVDTAGADDFHWFLAGDWPDDESARLQRQFDF